MTSSVHAVCLSLSLYLSLSVCRFLWCCAVKDGTLDIVWSDRHKSSFSPTLLLENSYSDWALDARAREMATTALPLDAPVPSTAFTRMMDTNDDEGLYEALRHVIENGFTVIRKTPSVPGIVKSIAERIAPISHSYVVSCTCVVIAAT